MKTHSYTAAAFHESLQEGRAAGELWVTAQGVIFQNGPTRMELPFTGLQVDPGGTEAKGVLSMRHPEHPGWTIYTSDRRIIDDEILQTNAVLQPLIAGLQRQRIRRRLLITVALLLLAAFMLSLVMTTAFDGAP